MSRAGDEKDGLPVAVENEVIPPSPSADLDASGRPEEEMERLSCWEGRSLRPGLLCNNGDAARLWKSWFITENVLLLKLALPLVRKRSSVLGCHFFL